MSSHELLDTVAKSHSPLISADQLEGLLDDKSVKLFDMRGTWSTPARALPEDYEEGHIPMATFLDWTQHFLQQDVPIGVAAVADETGAMKAFKTLGINEGDLVVLYDNYHHMLAGRVWWAMRHWGFTNVRVLNGGWGHWLALNKSVSREVPKIAPGTFHPQKQDTTRTSLAEFVDTKDQHCVIDARGPIGYAGKPDDPRTGHIPNALNVPYGAVLDADTGLFLAPETVSGVFDEQMPQWREKPIIASCGSGYAATVILLALSEQQRAASLFDGSFGVWKQDPERPIEQALNQNS